MADHLQREIEEILNRLDDFIPEEKKPNRMRRRLGSAFAGIGGWVSHIESRVSLGYLMLISLLLIFVAFAFRSTNVGQYALIAGLSLLGLTIVVSFIANRRARSVKRWRGQVVDLSGPSFIDRLQNWLRKRGSHTR
jgi:hypothetical protein